MNDNPVKRDRRSLRLRSFDYRAAGAYFVTICTYERLCTLDSPSIRSALERSWSRAACQGRRPQPYDFVVMPNHVHGIIWIRNPRPVEAQHARIQTVFAAGMSPVSGQAPDCRGAVPLLTHPKVPSGSLGAIVRAFKSASTKWINTIRNTPGAPVWQRNYYEHIVRDDTDLTRIRQYILENPAKWADDHNNPNNWLPESVANP